MKNESDTDYQYDRCSSRGICSINPATASLQEIIISYIKQAAFLELELKKYQSENKKITDIILNTISVISSNYEISETNFDMINSAFISELPEMIKLYDEFCKKEKIDNKKPKLNIPLDNKLSINEYIRLGEKEFRKRINDFPEENGTYYKILFILIKSISLNILTAKSYNAEMQDEIEFILKILNTLNFPSKDIKEVKRLITDSAAADCNLSEKINTLQEKFYGKPTSREVSYSTTKGKAVLVVGSNIRELEQILNELKNSNIDVYTHDNMIAAHTFPRFNEYENLKGQFGQGVENCLLDFSTFPGPIILTRHSLFNIENLYRGRLYTTDFAYSKGVINIKNNDFSDVIKSAEESKGFKTGRNCPHAIVGYEYENVINQIDNIIKSRKISDIFIIGIKSDTYNKEYYNELSQHSPDNVLIISLSCCESSGNIICLNTDFSNFALYRITKDMLKTYPQKISVFIPYCDKYTASFIINLNINEKCSVYINKQNNSSTNPIAISGLINEFGISETTSPKKDLTKILDIK